MPTIPSFTPKTPIVRTYQDFAGVDFTSDATNVQVNRSPDSVNMYKDYKSELGQAIETRPGFSNLVSLDYPIYGIHFFKKDSMAVLIHAGDKMLLWKNYPSKATEKDMELLYNKMNEIKSRSFVFGDILYINDGKNYLYYDGSKLGSVKDIAYIPTTTIARSPTGGGTILNPVNLLQPKRRNSFLADGKSRDFTLDTSNIDSTKVEATINGELKEEGVDFTVNRIAGTITFNSVPPAPGTIGQDNIIVTFSKTIHDYDNRIEECALNCIYDNRIFYSGNKEYPNALFNSQVNDPTYIADINYYQDGSDNVPITALLRVGDSLMVIKADDQQDAVVYYHTPNQVQIDKDTTKVTYPTKQGLAGIGCISQWGSTNFLDEPVFISKLGLESFTKLNLGLERSIEHKSSTVDGKLVNEIDLQNVHLEEWNGYLLCLINGHIYLADNRQKYQNKSTGQIEYEWYYWDNIGDFIKKTEPKPFEGDSVFLEDSSNKKIGNLSITGRSRQAVRSGKNAIKSFNRCGKSNISWIVDKNKLEKTMYFSLISSKALSETNRIFFNTIDNSLSAINKGTMVINENKKSIRQIDFTDEELNTLKGSDKDIIIQIYENNTEIDYTTITFGEAMLANTNNTDYEQYGASPSPEFPSRIRNTGDNVNLYNKDNANILNTMIDTKGLGVNAGDTYKTIYIPCKTSTEYTVSKLYDETKNRFALAYTNTEPKYSMEVEGYVTNANASKLTITTGANAKYLLAYVWITGGTSTYKEMLDSIKIEEGTQATPYSPYNCGNVEVTVSNENFFNPKIIPNNSIITVNDDDSITLANNLNTAGYTQTKRRLKELCKGLRPGDIAYVNIVTTDTPYIYLQGKTNQYWYNKNKLIITEDILEDYVVIYGGYQKVDKLQIQITKNKLEDYAPHEEQSIVFPLAKNQSMYEGDYLAEDGIHHTRKQIVLDGTEGWQLGATGNNLINQRFYLANNDIKSNGEILCNYFKEMYRGNIQITVEDVECCNISNGQYIQIKINKKIAGTVAEFKSYLKAQKEAGTPIIAECELESEIIEPFTPEQQQAYNAMQSIKTYEGGTNIFAYGAGVKGIYESIIEGYDFEKATLLKEYDGRLFFGTENGVIAEFRMYQYNDNGRTINCKWTTPADNFKNANHVKTTNKRGGIAYLKTFPNSSCKLKVKTDKTNEHEIARYVASGFSFGNFSFRDFSFTTAPKSFMQYKIKEKKWMNIQLIFYSDEIDRPFGIFMANLEGFIGGYKKGGY